MELEEGIRKFFSTALAIVRIITSCVSCMGLAAKSTHLPGVGDTMSKTHTAQEDVTPAPCSPGRSDW